MVLAVLCAADEDSERNKHMRKLIYVLVAAAVVFVLALVWLHGSAHASIPQATVGKTLANLEAAYQG